jgi:serine/threonine protein kinase
MTFEPQGCVWSLEFNPRLRAQNYQLQVICKGCADSEGNNAYLVDTVLVPKRKPSQQDSGLKEATEAFEFAQLQVRKAIVKLEFPDFPEGCKGRPFREVYQLNARLKSGSFATVCRGTHRATGKKVAIKCVLRKDLPPSDDAAIYDEVAILSALDHPHITPLIDFFDEKDCYFLVMELMSGGDLFDRIGKKKNYSEADARELCIKMLKAMAYCHELNIAHNDMKPKNLLLVSEEHDAYIKIADFGFAARVYEPKSLTKQCGTPFFVSPEILQRQPYDQKSDMWSIGVIIYLLLAGNLPFMGRSQKELFRKIVIGKYQFVDDSWSDVTNDARNLVEKLLVTDPDKRLSAKECLEHPWLKQDFGRLSLIKLQSTSQRLKTFNARMKLRSAMIAVDWVSSLQRQSWKDIPDTDEPSRRTSVAISEGNEDDSD